MPRYVESVAFDAPTVVTDDYGGAEDGWTEQFTTRAMFRYQKGAEAERAGRATGTTSFKVVMQSSAATRALTTEYRMRDTRRSVAYNIREIDAVSDRGRVWIVAESGVAV